MCMLHAYIYIYIYAGCIHGNYGYAHGKPQSQPPTVFRARPSCHLPQTAPPSSSSKRCFQPEARNSSTAWRAKQWGSWKERALLAWSKVEQSWPLQMYMQQQLSSCTSCTEKFSTPDWPDCSNGLSKEHGTGKFRNTWHTPISTHDSPVIALQIKGVAGQLAMLALSFIRCCKIRSMS